MSNYPQYAEINGKKYKINTDFRVAIECNRIAEDDTIGDLERALGVICTLFGEKALDNANDYKKLLKIAKKYLLCGKEAEDKINERKPDMDFIQDEGYIASSFQYDYKYNPYELDYVHWWKFSNDLNNLSNSEFGNCCILSRIRNLRNFDVSQIKDEKERRKIIEAKNEVALKKQNKDVKVKLTKEQQKSVDDFYKALGF